MPIQNGPISDCLAELQASEFSPFDLMSSRTLAEKLIELILVGAPAGPPAITAGLKNLAQLFTDFDCSKVKVVVFGGGTGLSTIIGGDSLTINWLESPFCGLKEVFPKTKAVVGTADDGGSTGELLKDLPLIGLGDLRHVLLSSIQEDRLRNCYKLDEAGARQVVADLYFLFNYRFSQPLCRIDDLFDDGGIKLESLPALMAEGLLGLIRRLFDDHELLKTMARPHCLGNLLIASSIYANVDGGSELIDPAAIHAGLRFLIDLLGVGSDAVLPCTTTPSLLKLIYSNGVVVSGENKSGFASRGYPVELVYSGFTDPSPHVLPEVLESIRLADIVIFAPGSLYTSIVPILQISSINRAVRANEKAIKILAANIWVQSGETDLARDDPGRRFYVSDLIKAYQHNIPGGVRGLFKHVMLLGMHDIPGSILQSYAVEGKIPIYLDRGKVWQMGFLPVEASIFSKDALVDRKVKHDPADFAKAVKILWAGRNYFEDDSFGEIDLPLPPSASNNMLQKTEIPCLRFRAIVDRLAELRVDQIDRLADILWRHCDIPVEHLSFIKGVSIVELSDWPRCQDWDKIYSFYDPDDKQLKIRADMLTADRFEVAFLMALGQSLLGNYALHKEIVPFDLNGDLLGKVFHLSLRQPMERSCFFEDREIKQYLILARMRPLDSDADHFTRVLNGEEGFTPPGLLFGLIYAWYLDNRFASHIEYKMAIARTAASDLVPELLRTKIRRHKMVDFFRTVVFKQSMN